MPSGSATPVVITPEGLLKHWQGHRRLSRRMIEAFPEDKLFTYSIGGMRPYGVLALEMISMGAPMVHGTATGEWKGWEMPEARTKEELLQQWDAGTAQIEAFWPKIPLERFQETITAFGQYTDTTTNLLLYCIDNEIHHRGQGYVYLRSLGIEPPAFFARE
jgi:uncharacterized damage-inducible protein DinB